MFIKVFFYPLMEQKNECCVIVIESQSMDFFGKKRKILAVTGKKFVI